MNLAQQALRANNLSRTRELLALHAPQPGSVDLRDWEWRYLWSQARPDDHEHFFQANARIKSIAYDSSGKIIAICDAKHRLVVLDVASRTQLLERSGVIGLAFAQRSPVLAFGQFLSNGSFEVVVWNAETKDEPEVVYRLAHLWEQVSWREPYLWFYPEDDRLLIIWKASETRRKIAALELSSRTLLWERVLDSADLRATTQSAATSSDRSLLAASADTGRLRVLETQSGRERFSIGITSEYVSALVFSPDGGSVISAGAYTDTHIRIWDARSGALRQTLEGHRGYITKLVFSTDGESLVSCSADQTIRFWEWPTGKPSGVLRGHLDEVDGAAFSPDGRTLASHSKDGAVYLWDSTKESRQLGYRSLPCSISKAVFTPDSSQVLAVEPGGGVAFWDAGTRRETRRLWSGSSDRKNITLSADARWVAYRDPGNVFHILNSGSGTKIASFAAPAQTASAMFAENGEFLVIFYETPEHMMAEVRETRTWQPTGSIPTSRDDFKFAAATSLPNSLAIVEDSGLIRFHDLALRGLNPRIIQNQCEFDSISVSPDGRFVAFGWDGVQIWHMESLQRVELIQSFILGEHGTAFSPDGRRFAACSNGMEAVKLWDTETRKEVLTLSGEGSIFGNLIFSPDSRFLLAVSSAGVSHFWHAPLLEQIPEVKASRPTDEP